MLHAVRHLRRPNRWIVALRTDDVAAHDRFVLELLEPRLLLSAAPSADPSDASDELPYSILVESQAVNDFLTSAGTSFNDVTLSVFEGPPDLQYQASVLWDDGAQSDASIVPQSDGR